MTGGEQGRDDTGEFLNGDLGSQVDPDFVRGLLGGPGRDVVELGDGSSRTDNTEHGVDRYMCAFTRRHQGRFTCVNLLLRERV